MVDQDFPVIKGTQLHISCVGGEQVEGDNVIRCVSDTMFQYSTQPTCSKSSAVNKPFSPCSPSTGISP